ncbi:DUF3040 domain-containing protein [Propionibacteriaceae bacterium G1746]
MALSEEEQRRLEALEALLAEDDPKLANTLRGTSSHSVSGKRLVVAAIGSIVGIALLVAGMQWHWSISVVGFLVMFGSTAWMVMGRRGSSPDDDDDRTHKPGPYTPSGSHHTSSSAFMDKLEERWRRRQDEGH